MLLLALEISYITVQGLCELAILFSSKFKKKWTFKQKKGWLDSYEWIIHLPKWIIFICENKFTFNLEMNYLCAAKVSM